VCSCLCECRCCTVIQVVVWWHCNLARCLGQVFSDMHITPHPGPGPGNVIEIKVNVCAQPTAIRQAISLRISAPVFGFVWAFSLIKPRLDHTCVQYTVTSSISRNGPLRSKLLGRQIYLTVESVKSISRA
jgi:hypothetical protein